MINLTSLHRQWEPICCDTSAERKRDSKCYTICKRGGAGAEGAGIQRAAGVPNIPRLDQSSYDVENAQVKTNGNVMNHTNLDKSYKMSANISERHSFA